MSSDLAKFKEALHAAVASNALVIHAKWIAQLHQSSEPDDMRKYMEFAAKVTGANVDAARDPHAGLPTFHFNIGGRGTQQVTVTVGAPPPAQEPLEVVEEVPIDPDAEAAKQIKAASNLAMTLDDLLGVPDDVGVPRD